MPSRLTPPPGHLSSPGPHDVRESGKQGQESKESQECVAGRDVGRRSRWAACLVCLHVSSGACAHRDLTTGAPTLRKITRALARGHRLLSVPPATLAGHWCPGAFKRRHSFGQQLGTEDFGHLWASGRWGIVLFRGQNPIHENDVDSATGWLGGAPTRRPALWAEGCQLDVCTQFSPGGFSLALNLPSFNVCGRKGPAWYFRRERLQRRAGMRAARPGFSVPTSCPLGPGGSMVVFALRAPFWKTGIENTRHTLPSHTSLR